MALTLISSGSAALTGLEFLANGTFGNALENGQPSPHSSKCVGVNFGFESCAAQVVLNVAICVVVVAIAGLTMGLTLAIYSLDVKAIEAELEDESTSKEEKKKLQRLKNLSDAHHWALVGLLLVDALCVEGLPMLLSELFHDVAQHEVVTIATSGVSILIFGEVLPQALAIRFARPFAGAFFVVPWICMFGTAPISWPIAKALDFVIGHKVVRGFSRGEIRELIYAQSARKRTRERNAAAWMSPAGGDGGSDSTFAGGRISNAGGYGTTASAAHHNESGSLLIPARESVYWESRGGSQAPLMGGQQATTRATTGPFMGDEDDELCNAALVLGGRPLTRLERKLMFGALRMRDAVVGQVMKKHLNQVMMLPADEPLCPAIIRKIHMDGYSRIPLFRNDKTNIVGCLMARSLLKLGFRPGAQVSASREPSPVPATCSPPPDTSADKSEESKKTMDGDAEKDNNKGEGGDVKKGASKRSGAAAHFAKDKKDVLPPPLELSSFVPGRVRSDSDLLSLYDTIAQAKTERLAVVVDEHDRAIGIVTGNDVLGFVMHMTLDDEYSLTQRAAVDVHEALRAAGQRVRASNRASLGPGLASNGSFQSFRVESFRAPLSTRVSSATPAPAPAPAPHHSTHPPVRPGSHAPRGEGRLGSPSRGSPVVSAARLAPPEGSK